MILKQLQKEVVPTEEFLKETKVGVIIGKLRTHSAPAVSELCKVIVKKWKGAVKNTGSKSSTATKKEKAEKPSASASATPSVSATPASVSPTPTPSRKPSISLPVSSNQPTVRTSKTDGIKTGTLGDVTRDKCAEMIYDALASDSGAPSEQIFSRAIAVESSVYSEFGDVNANYKNKIRRLFHNLKDKSNPRLRESVVMGDLAVTKFCGMTVQEMASEDRQQADKQLNESNLFKSLGAGAQEAETDAFKCGRCHLRKTRYRQAQTRSADEPMTTFVTCVNCGNRWKFS